MANTATEAPAAYVLATQFHDTVRELLDELGPEHGHLAIEMLTYSERIMGNVGAAEAPFAADRRREHYQIAFGAACGCAAACDMVYRLRIAPKEMTRRANLLLSSLAAMIRPIAEEGRAPRGEEEEAILGEIFGAIDPDREPWEDDLWEDDDEDETW